MTTFKVGDRVAVYSAASACQPREVGSVVTAAGSPALVKVKVDGAYGFVLAHPKQCRKLARRERVWLPKQVTPFYAASYQGGGWSWLREEPSEGAAHLFREFIEVKRKEKKP